MRRFRRWRAKQELLQVQADLAAWLVDDGSLSPDEVRHSPYRLQLRERWLRAVASLEDAGGQDPWPGLTREREA